MSQFFGKLDIFSKDLRIYLGFLVRSCLFITLDPNPEDWILDSVGKSHFYHILESGGPIYVICVQCSLSLGGKHGMYKRGMLKAAPVGSPRDTSFRI